VTRAATILIYGRVPLLLDTRRMVLETAGFCVLTASDIDRVEHAIEYEDIGLVILCHSLSVEETNVALAAVSALKPELPVLMLDTNSIHSPSRSNIDIHGSRNGPRDLIKVASIALDRDVVAEDGTQVAPYGGLLPATEHG